MTTTEDLLFEIGCEELPASFVDKALEALPDLVRQSLSGLRLEHGTIHALGTPRRLTVMVEQLATRQKDLSEAVMGPPVTVAFKDGEPTKAAEAFAKKIGVGVEALEQVETDKGVYVRGVRDEKGRPSAEMLPDALAAITHAIPFRKSMRWGDGDWAFGRPVRWLCVLLGGDVVDVKVGHLTAGRVSYGHRFVHPDPIEFEAPTHYVDRLRAARVFVDPAERRALMLKRLEEAASKAGLELIDDAFLVGENLSLVEDPQVILGSFEEEFLELPDEVILEVARGHQRYFGLRQPGGGLAPAYLAVVNTAENPEAIKLGNDRVMRARLADAAFFYREDLKKPLADRKSELEGIVFQKRLGSVLDKVNRMESLCGALGRQLGLPSETIEVASAGAGICKNDLVTLMVGEFGELQGQIGQAYALVQSVGEPVARVISEHYRPKGAGDEVAADDASALVALADRLDTLVGCFAIGLSPTGGADPYALRRACLGVLRTCFERGFDLRLSDALSAAYAGFSGVELDLEESALIEALQGFFRDRARGALSDSLSLDAVDAALAVAADRPLDARARAAALVSLDVSTRKALGEVFKRASNIAKSAPEGEAERGDEPAEGALYDAFYACKQRVIESGERADYTEAFAQLAGLAPVLATYFDEVLIMAEDEAVKRRRLCLMRDISETCGNVARLELLGRVGDDS